jgi:hypothetical protein
MLVLPVRRAKGQVRVVPSAEDARSSLRHRVRVPEGIGEGPLDRGGAAPISELPLHSYA